jgi:hypothetical protein
MALKACKKSCGKSSGECSRCRKTRCTSGNSSPKNGNFGFALNDSQFVRPQYLNFLLLIDAGIFIVRGAESPPWWIWPAKATTAALFGEIPNRVLLSPNHHRPQHGMGSGTK